MCKFVVGRQARSHIIDRVCERFLHGDRTDTKCRTQAKALLNSALAALRSQTPPGWRFTRNPAAHFFISLLGRDPRVPEGVSSASQLKILGGTYRLGAAGRELEKRLKYLSSQLHTRSGAGAPDDVIGASSVRQELIALRDLYLQDLQDPAATITHEIKTVYPASEDIAQRRRTRKQSMEVYRHTMVLRSMNLPRLHASLPNALLCETDEGQPGYQLWVRQGESWWAPQLKATRRASEVALFVPIHSDGLDREAGQLWSFDTQGAITPLTGACGIPNLRGRCQVPEGFRSESYWNLPTRLDALWLDCDYQQRERVPTLSGRQIVLFSVINWIYELATAETDKAVAPPAWLGKGKDG